MTKNKKLPALNPTLIESSIRSKTKRSKKSLEYFSPATWEGDAKYFIGIEDEKKIYITRIKTPIERVFFPKAIAEFDKNDFSKYKIRLSALGYLVGLLVLGGIIFNLFSAYFNENILHDLLGTLSFALGFIAFTLIDQQLLERKINSSFNQKKTDKP